MGLADVLTIVSFDLAERRIIRRFESRYLASNIYTLCRGVGGKPDLRPRDGNAAAGVTGRTPLVFFLVIGPVLALKECDG